MNNIWIIAQADTNGASEVTSETVTEEQLTTATQTDSNTPATPPKKPGFQSQQIIFFVLIAAVFYFLMFRGPRKKQQKHVQMVKSLQKNDKVRTIGGIIGTVIEVKDDEITVKIDESNNTKIKVAPEAIGRNLSQENK
ncbi:MAG: preprotein translocase subunit YajC [Phycisphaerae bacterium]|nr:preprotein translocase subunit YajC [Phycisphaerae bacterium]